MQSHELEKLGWRTVDFLPPPRADLDEGEIAKQIADRNNRLVDRNRPSFPLAWLERHARREPIVLSALHLDNIVLLHLPAEPFVQYQLRAQKFAPERFVATAGYGDGGPWYFPTREEYSRGGYEVRVTWSDRMADGLLTDGIRQLVS